MEPLRYPLSESLADTLQAASGKPLREITPEAAASGELSPADLQVNATTLQQQAEIARNAGYPQLAENLLRAAELTRVPNETLLQMYDKLRPGRASYEELIQLAEALIEKYQAPQTAAFVREAAQVYQERRLTGSSGA